MVSRSVCIPAAEGLQTWSEPGPSQTLEAFSELIPPAFLVSVSSCTDDIANTLDTALLSISAGLN